MKKVVYLIGTGATKAEMEHQGIEGDVSMKGIGEQVLELSRQTDGEYWRLYQAVTHIGEQDIELIMSLLEGCIPSESARVRNVCDELKKLFRSYLISQVNEQGVKTKIMSSLLHVHANCGAKMGIDGEELIGILTINYDSLIDEAFAEVHDSINYGYDFESHTYQMNKSIPPLLKLHGSFNWKIYNQHSLEVAQEFQKIEYDDDFSGWIPPSVFKRPPEGVYEAIWKQAVKLLTNCDTLRVIGSSLRDQDLALLSLLFTTRIRNTAGYKIELIVPDETAQGDDTNPGIIPRLRFLGTMKRLSSLPEYEDAKYRGNPFYDWINMKIVEIERNGMTLTADEFLNQRLWEI